MRRLLLLLAFLAAGCARDSGWRSVCLDPARPGISANAPNAACARRIRVCMRNICDGRAW